MDIMLSPFIGNFKVTSPRGYRYMFGKWEYHKGLDIVGLDSKEVHAITDGVVKTNYEANGAGNYVVVTMPDQRRVYYMHLASFNVKTGQIVKKGDILGIMGATGRVTGAHTHLELRPAGTTRDSLDISQFTGIPNKIGNYYYEPKVEEHWCDSFKKQMIDCRLIPDYLVNEVGNYDMQCPIGTLLVLMNNCTYGDYIPSDYVKNLNYMTALDSLVNKGIILDKKMWSKFNSPIEKKYLATLVAKSLSLYRKNMPVVKNIVIDRKKWYDMYYEYLANREVITDIYYWISDADEPALYSDVIAILYKAFVRYV